MDGGLEHGSITGPEFHFKAAWTRDYEAGKYGRCEPCVSYLHRRTSSRLAKSRSGNGLGNFPKFLSAILALSWHGFTAFSRLMPNETLVPAADGL